MRKSITRLSDEASVRRGLRVPFLGVSSVPAGSFLYYLAFFLYSLGCLLLLTSAVRSGYDFVLGASRIMKLFAVLLLCFKCFAFQRYNSKQFFTVACLGLVALLSYLGANDLTITAAIMFVVAGKGIDVKVLGGISLFVCAVVMAIALMGYFSGAFESVVMSRDGLVGVRTSVGFRHPNSFGIVCAWMCISLAVVRNMYVGIASFAVAAVVVFVVSEISDSRSAIGALLIALVFFFLASRIKRTNSKKALTAVLAAIVLVLAVASFYLMVFYSSANAIDSWLNSLLSGRVSLMNWYFENHSPSLFGQDVSLLPAKYSNGGQTVSTFVVDNGYAHLYLHYGPLVAALILLSAGALFWASYRKGYLDVTLVGFAAVACLGFGEHDFLCFEFNYFMLGFAYLIYGFPELQPSDDLGRSC